MAVDRHKLRKFLGGDFTILRLIRTLLLGYAGIVCFAQLFSDNIIFQPQPVSYHDCPEIIKITTPDGTRISTLHFLNPNAIFTILYSHGNAEDIGDIRPIANALANHGFSVLAYDYRGYGTSDGKPSEHGVYQDIEAVHGYMVDEMKISPRSIIALGRSLGNGPTIHLASVKDVAGIILESPFVSAYRVVTKFPVIPFDKFRNGAMIHRVTCPVLVIHGDNDGIIPFWHGQAIFEKANEPKLSLWVKGAGHLDLMEMAGSRYWEAISNLLKIIESHGKCDEVLPQMYET